MAAAVSSTRTVLLLQNCRSTLHNSGKFIFPCRRNLHGFVSGRVSKSSVKQYQIVPPTICPISHSSIHGAMGASDLVAVNSTPEKAGLDVLSSLFHPGDHAFSDNSWLSLVAAVFVAVPLIQKLLSLSKEVDTAAQTVKKIERTVEEMAEDVERSRKEIAKALVDVTTGLKKVVRIVEVSAKQSVKFDEMVDDLSEKVDELEDRVDELLIKKTNATGK